MNKIVTKGFSLIEVLMSVATIAIIAGMSVPVYQGFQVRNDAQLAVDAISQSLRRAQLLSQVMAGDSSWGVEISDNITLFRGNSFASRNANYDEIFPFYPSLTHTGVDEIVFSKREGMPLSLGTMNIATNTGLLYSLTINSKGIIDY